MVAFARSLRAKRDVRGFSTRDRFSGTDQVGADRARAAARSERYGFARDVIREKPAAWFVNRHGDDRSVEARRRMEPGACARVRACHRSRPEVDFAPFRKRPSGELARLANRIVLLPGAGRPGKQWPVERFARVGEAHRKRRARRLGSRRRRARARASAPRWRRRRTSASWLRPLRHAKLVIGADTGPLHLAAALGTPLIGLYGPTDPARNGPYGQLDRVVSIVRDDEVDGSTSPSTTSCAVLQINAR